MFKKIATVLLMISLVVSTFAGCSSKEKSVKVDKDGNKQFTAFFAVPGKELSADNRVMKKIAEKTGATVDMKWLTGQSSAEACGTLIASQEYPDFIDGGDGTQQLIDAGALVPIDEYLDKYENIKKFYTEADWNKLRQEDGHIYIIPQFDNVYEKDMTTYVNGEAFWIQNKVLKWANYPKITTLDEYFDLIEKYIKANPKMENGTPHIGYEILCEDWKYFCLENPPFFLDGYPNDGCCIINPETITAIDYNTTDTAKRYFSKLNDEFKKGIIDPETFTMSYDQYIEKISSGRVLGMVDQYWNFRTAEDTLKQQGLNECEYIPLGIVMDKDTKPRYYSKNAISVANGVGISVSCKDIDGAFKFINDLLSPEVMTLRFWGEEGIDYQVDEQGMFYRNDEQRKQQHDAAWKTDNWCDYSYFPYYKGMNLDKKNAYAPDEQVKEYFDALSTEKQECLKAYNCKTELELVNEPEENSTWFPMWSYTNAWTSDTDYGIAKVNMDEVKHEWLPKVVMSKEFDSEWENYLKEYNSRVDVECYLNALTTEARRRDKVVKGK